MLSAVSCASASKNIQPQINSLVAANRLDKALTLMGNDPSIYGPHNHLLFWLDKGMIAHLNKKTQESIDAFEQAEKLNEVLYTKSLSQMANTWIVNNAKEDYRGDEQEYVMVNVFQAFNFAAIDNIDEALVEARRLDSKLKTIGTRYQNPFAYFLSGLLWHVSKEPNANEDAAIDFQKALGLYENPPQILKDLLQETKSLRNNSKARIYVVEYTGYIPIKVADAFPLPLDGGHLTKFSFPRYQDRYSEVKSSRFKIRHGGIADVQESQVVCDLGALAKKILDAKKASINAKAVIRPLLKYGAQKAAEIPVRDKGGDLAGDLMGVAGSIYNLASEEADVRTWQTLPNQIRLAVFDVDAGTYDIEVDDLDADGSTISHRVVSTVTVKHGDNKFIISRSWL